MASSYRIYAIGSAFCIALLGSPVSFADSPPSPSGAPLTSGQISSEFQNLSPDAKAALLKQLQASGSNMTPEQMKASFNSLPPELQSQLQAKWDGLSDAQREALKKMSPDALKQMFGQKIKQMMAPVQKALDAGADFAQKARSYVQKFLGKIFGSGNSKASP